MTYADRMPRVHAPAPGPDPGGVYHVRPFAAGYLIERTVATADGESVRIVVAAYRPIRPADPA